MEIEVWKLGLILNRLTCSNLVLGFRCTRRTVRRCIFIGSVSGLDADVPLWTLCTHGVGTNGSSFLALVTSERASVEILDVDGVGVGVLMPPLGQISWPVVGL